MDNDPDLINGFLKHYFTFLRLAEETVERIVQQETDPKKGIKLLDIQTSLKLKLKVHNFPKTKIATDSCTLIQSVIRNKKGCLVRLSNLIITEIISTGSFPKKCMFRGNCDCSKGELRCIRVNLIDYVKAADDLSKASMSLYTPKCQECKAEYNKCLANDVFESYQLVKVQPFFSKKDFFLTYLQLDDPSMAQVGLILEGIFYLDSVTKFNFKQGRLIGENFRILMGVTLPSHSILDIMSDKPQKSLLYLARDKKNYLNEVKSLNEEERIINSVHIGAKNIQILLKNIQSPQVPASFDLTILIGLLWHVHGNRDGLGSYLSSTLPELAKFSNQDILNLNVANSKLNMLIFSSNCPLLVSRTRELARGMANLDELPSIIDEETLKTWLVTNNSCILIIQNLHCLKPTIRNLITTVIENGILHLSEGVQIPIDCSFLVFEHSKDILSTKKASNEYLSWSFTACFDIVLDVNDAGERGLNNILAIHGGVIESRLNYCIPSRSTFTAGESKLSGLSKLTNYCKKFAGQQDQEQVSADSSIETKVAGKMSLGFLAQLGEMNRVSPKLKLSFKKIAVGMRMIRAFVNEDTSLLMKVLRVESTGRFEVDPIDALVASALIDASQTILSPSYRPVFKEFALQFAITLDSSLDNPTDCKTPRLPVAADQRAFEELMGHLKEIMFSSMDYYL